MIVKGSTNVWTWGRLGRKGGKACLRCFNLSPLGQQSGCIECVTRLYLSVHIIYRNKFNTCTGERCCLAGRQVPRVVSTDTWVWGACVLKWGLFPRVHTIVQALGLAKSTIQKIQVPLQLKIKREPKHGDAFLFGGCVSCYVHKSSRVKSLLL